MKPRFGIRIEDNQNFEDHSYSYYNSTLRTTVNLLSTVRQRDINLRTELALRMAQAPIKIEHLKQSAAPCNNMRD